MLADLAVSFQLFIVLNPSVCMFSEEKKGLSSLPFPARFLAVHWKDYWLKAVIGFYFLSIKINIAVVQTLKKLRLVSSSYLFSFIMNDFLVSSIDI